MLTWDTVKIGNLVVRERIHVDGRLNHRGIEVVRRSRKGNSEVRSGVHVVCVLSREVLVQVEGYGSASAQTLHGFQDSV